MLAGGRRFAGVATDFLTDEAGCDFVEVTGELGLQFAELGQERLIYKLLWYAQQDCRRPLPSGTVRFQAAATAKRQE